jgi:hypothetical protein
VSHAAARRVRDLEGFGRLTVLDRVDLVVKAGEVVALTGEERRRQEHLCGSAPDWFVPMPRGAGQRADRLLPAVPGLFSCSRGRPPRDVQSRRRIGRAESLRLGHEILEEFGYRCTSVSSPAICQAALARSRT